MWLAIARRVNRSLDVHYADNVDNGWWNEAEPLAERIHFMRSIVINWFYVQLFKKEIFIYLFFCLLINIVDIVDIDYELYTIYLL